MVHPFPAHIWCAGFFWNSKAIEHFLGGTAALVFFLSLFKRFDPQMLKAFQEGWEDFAE